eukprot:2791264-Pyramimonas_sp.AAC.1
MEWNAQGGCHAGAWEALRYGAAPTPQAPAWSAEPSGWMGCQSAAASWAVQPGNAQQALLGSGLQLWGPGQAPAGATVPPGFGSAGEGAQQGVLQAVEADVVDPLFPEYRRLQEHGSSGAGREQSSQGERRGTT